METKGLILSMHSLKLPKERKPAMLLEPSHLQLGSPRALKRSMSPKFAELQRTAMRQRVSSPKALKISQLSPAKRRAFLGIPKSRQELISQYRHIQVFDFESVTPKRPARLSSYKLDAAELLTTSLKKHYNKFFFVWRKHARDLKKEQIRKETASQSESASIRLVLTPSRARMLTPDIERRLRSGTESKLSEKAVSLWSERLTTDPAVKRSSQPSPIYTEMQCEPTYGQAKTTGKYSTAEASIQVSPPLLTELSGELYADQQDERLAVVSSISHPDVGSEASPTLTPEATGNAIRLVFAIALILQRRKQIVFARLRPAGEPPRSSLKSPSLPEHPAPSRSPHPVRYSIQKLEKLTSTVHRVVVAPHWERLKTETRYRILSDLCHTLDSLYQAALRTALAALQAVPKANLLQRKPAISLKTALNTLLAARLQTAFNTTRHVASLRRRRQAVLNTKLRYCFQVCDLARVRLLARYFNRLRHRELLSLSVPKTDTRWRDSAVPLGLKVISQILVQAKTRGLRESLHVVERYSADLARAQTRFKATLALSAPLGQAAQRQWVELFHSFRQAKQTAVLIHKGKRTITRMIRRYFRETKTQLKTAFFVWKSVQQVKADAPLSLACPEIPLFGQILKRLLNRRAAWGVGRLKANYFGFDLSPAVPSGSRAAAVALTAVISRAVRAACEGAIHRMTAEDSTGPVSAHSQQWAKRVATRLICGWVRGQERKRMRAGFTQWSRAERLSRGLAVVSRLQRVRALPTWRRVAVNSKQKQRGVELFRVSLRKKLSVFFACFRAGDVSVHFEDPRYPLEQRLALQLALEKLNTNHAVVKSAAVANWRSSDLHASLQQLSQRALAVSVVLRMTQTIRPCVRTLQRTAFQSLIIIP